MTLPVDEFVKVYRNLHKATWSLVAVVGPRKGRVIGYSDTVELASPQLTISEAGRQRAVREQRRNVHAYVMGRVLAPGTLTTRLLERVRYNPFRAGCFTNGSGACVYAAGVALLDDQGQLWMNVSPDRAILLDSAEATFRARAKELGLGEADIESFLARHRADGTLTRLAAEEARL